MTRHLPLILAACFAGCAPELDFVAWDPLEPAEVSTALNEPTASIANLLRPERLQAIADRMPLVLQHTRFAARVVDALGEATESLATDAGSPGATGDDPIGTQSSHGTSYYLGVGCPGSGSEPDYDTAHGELRIDSERLDSLDPRVLLDGGDVLFRFRDCQIGEVLVDGEAPAALEVGREVVDPTVAFPVTPSAFAMAVDLSALQVEGTVSPVGVTGLLCRGFGSCAEHQDVKAQLGGGELGTAVVSFSLERNFWRRPVSVALALSTANGSASCEYAPDDRSLACAVDDD